MNIMNEKVYIFFLYFKLRESPWDFESSERIGNVMKSAKTIGPVDIDSAAI